MTMSRRLMRGLCATTALTALLATAPVRFAPGLDGTLALKTNMAFARGGDDHGGSSGGGGGDRGGDDHGGSSGGGSNDRGGDDHGGSSGSGSNDHGSDDHGSSSSGSADGGGDDHGGNSGRGAGDDFAGDDRGGGSKVEIEGDRIEITFADGTKQEVGNGRFEQKNAAGQTVVERPATAADVDQLRATAAGAGTSISAASVSSKGAKMEVSGRDIEVTYADGWKEQIDNDRYEMKDPNENTVVERAATSDDRSRLESALDF